MKFILIWLIFIAITTACAGPKPILYPNAHYQQVGSEAAEEDIEACRQLAENSGASPRQGKSAQVGTSTVAGGAIGAAAGAVGGAVIGNPGRGAKVGAASGGTAGLLRGLFKKSSPSGGYRQFVDRCLKERGYEPTGWE